MQISDMHSNNAQSKLFNGRQWEDQDDWNTFDQVYSQIMTYYAKYDESGSAKYFQASNT